MKTHFSLLLLSSICSLYLSCSKDDPTPPTPVDPCAATKKKTPLHLFWQQNLTVPANGTTITLLPGFYQDNVLYAYGGVYSQTLVLADGKTGTPVWEKPVDMVGLNPNIPAVHGDYLYYKKTFTGGLKRVPLNNSGPAADFAVFPGYTAEHFQFYGNSIVVQYQDGNQEHTALVNTETGGIDNIFSYPRPANTSSGVFLTGIPRLWNLANGDTVLSILLDESAQHYRLLSLNLSKGDTLYSILIDESNTIYFDPEKFLLQANEGRFFVAFEDKVHCYDALTGTKRWSYTSAQAISNAPLSLFIAGNTLLVLGKPSASAALDAGTGAPLWQNNLSLLQTSGSVYPTFIGQRMFFVQKPDLIGINLQNECEDWRFASPNPHPDKYDGFKPGICYHESLNTLFICDNDHIMAIRYPD